MGQLTNTPDPRMPPKNQTCCVMCSLSTTFPPGKKSRMLHSTHRMDRGSRVMPRHFANPPEHILKTDASTTSRSSNSLSSKTGGKSSLWTLKSSKNYLFWVPLVGLDWFHKSFWKVLLKSFFQELFLQKITLNAPSDIVCFTCPVSADYQRFIWAFIAPRLS